MHLRTILNNCTNFKGFCFVNEELNSKKKIIYVDIKARKGSKAICSKCETASPGYDTLPERTVKFIPFWGYQVLFRFRPRRVQCPNCNRVVVEKLPWCDGKHQITTIYAAFLANWAKDLAWKRVAERFKTSWQTVFSAVSMVVAFGLSNRNLENITAIGVDEVAWQKGHNYLTLVYQINPGSRRLLWIGLGRTQKTLTDFFRSMKGFCKNFAKNIQIVCSDMWKPYLKVISKEIPQALNVLDRFHIMQKFSKALDKVRAQEARRLKEEKLDPVLTNSRWCFLKRRENLTEKQGFKLKKLLKMNLTTVRAYLLKEQFQKFWNYNSPTWAKKFFVQWQHAAMRSRIEPIKKVAKTLEKHMELILNYFRAKKQFSSGIVEGMNLKVNLSIRKAYGFKSFKIAETALYHQLGELPEPEFTHKFW